jgi:very-short-patch-repair endonuclease
MALGAACQPPKALPLDGEGLGWGVSAGLEVDTPYGPGVRSSSSRFDHDRHAPGATKRARRLRQTAPVSERKLWEALRKLQLGIRRQAPIGRFVADFAHHGARLVIEVDGRSHDLPAAQAYDAERDAWLTSQGYRVIRVRDDLAFGRPFDVAERIGQIIQARTGKKAEPNSAQPSVSADTPPSPTLPPLRRKGE